MEDDRPTAARVPAQEEDEEDALPDWGMFAKLKANQKNSTDVFIPKRGEKDFEPIATVSAPSTTHQTLADFQANTLINSRNALFSAISSGSRHHGSKAYNSFTWRPDVDGGRATADGATFGVHFMNLGIHSVERKRLELLPEEALYMVERGAIELWREHEVASGGEGKGSEVVRVPMTVQQAWAELIGHDELTVDRFGVYAYLKRLGYVVIRARALPPAPARPPKPVPRSLLQIVQAPLLAARAWLLRVLASIRAFRFGSLNRTLQLAVTRTLQFHEGTYSSLLSGRRWATYGDIFGRLQIIPTGHDLALPRGPAEHTPSKLVPLQPVAPHPTLPSLETNPYQPFYHIYKPSTKFKKSAPGPPDFRLVVINSNTTSMPDMFEFATMFAALPLPSPAASASPSPPTPKPLTSGSASQPPTPSKPPARPRPNNRRPPPPPPKPSAFRKLVARVPWAGKLLPKPEAARKFNGPNKAVLYPKLKTGRRDILVAVVDNGTSSFLRFNESEFGKLPWQGVPRRA